MLYNLGFELIVIVTLSLFMCALITWGSILQAGVFS